MRIAVQMKNLIGKMRYFSGNWVVFCMEHDVGDAMTLFNSICFNDDL